MLSELCKKDSLWRDYAFKICGDRNLADDLVQEMYLRRLDNDRGQQMTDYYIVCTMKSIYLNMKATNRLICVEDLKHIGEITENFQPDDNEQKLLERVEQLPFKKKELLELNYYYSLREIEEKYNINYGYVHRAVTDARKEVLGNEINKYKNKRLKHRIMKSKGLGDTIEKLTTATGIKRVVHWIFGEDCGCEERKQYLNELLPYPANCLTPEQINDYQNFVDTRGISLTGNGKATGTLSKQEIDFVTSFYSNVFNRKKLTGLCYTCNGTAKLLTEMVYKLDTVFVNNIPEPKKQTKKQSR